MFCTKCGSALKVGARFCPSCGNGVSPGGTDSHAAPRVPTGPPAGPVRAPTANSPAGPVRAPAANSIDFRRLGTGDFIAGGATIFVFIALLLPWYSIDGFSTSALGNGAGGWRFLILLLTIGIVGYLFARTFSSNGFRLPIPHWQLLTMSTALNGLLILLAFVIKPGGQLSWSFGAYLGLIAGIVAIVGSAIRSNEPEVIVPGQVAYGATRVAPGPSHASRPSHQSTFAPPAPVANPTPVPPPVAQESIVVTPPPASFPLDLETTQHFAPAASTDPVALSGEANTSWGSIPSPPEPVHANAERTCAACGALVLPANRFCNACGAATP